MSEVSLKITADGKAATASIQQVQGALKGVGEQASQAATSLQATGIMIETIGQLHSIFQTTSMDQQGYGVGGPIQIIPWPRPPPVG